MFCDNNFQVKMSGALPRLSDDSKRIDTLKIFTPFNPWAPKRALFGQVKPRSANIVLNSIDYMQRIGSKD